MRPPPREINPPRKAVECARCELRRSFPDPDNTVADHVGEKSAAAVPLIERRDKIRHLFCVMSPASTAASSSPFRRTPL
jgi:hypothetical protein